MSNVLRTAVLGTLAIQGGGVAGALPLSQNSAEAAAVKALSADSTAAQLAGYKLSVGQQAPHPISADTWVAELGGLSNLKPNKPKPNKSKPNRQFRGA
jgi:hypothetical protein